jgi:hypothetical protein
MESKDEHPAVNECDLAAAGWHTFQVSRQRRDGIRAHNKLSQTMWREDTIPLPAGAAIYERHQDWLWTVYFTPVFCTRYPDIIALFKAKPCDPPRLDELRLWIGEPFLA